MNFQSMLRDMLRERNIRESWVKQTLEKPDKREKKENSTIHYIKSIEEHEGNYLRVVLNPYSLIAG